MKPEHVNTHTQTSCWNIPHHHLRDFLPPPSKTPSTKKQNKKGFSLVELSMVLVAIAGVIFVVIAGVSLVKKAKLSRIIEDVNEITKAVERFEKTYGALPGDLSDVTPLPGASPAAVSGNGNGIIDTTERLHFWRHLAIAGFLPGSYDGVSNIPGQGIPEGSIKSSAMSIKTPDGSLGESSQAIVITFMGVDSGGVADRGIVTPADVYSMDTRLDDGDAGSGFIRASDGVGQSSGDCQTNGVYNSNETSVTSCVVHFVRDGLDTTGVAQSISCGNLGSKRISPSESCPVGYARQPKPGVAVGTLVGMVETCGSDGSWGNAENFCSAVLCAGDVGVGDTRLLACPSGYTGTGISQTCQPNGIFGANDPDCAIGLGPCPTDGEQKILSCLEGNVGSVAMICTSGNWAVSSNTCGSIQCGGSDVGTERTGTSNGAPACDANSSFAGSYVGDVTEACTADGTWKVVTNECTPFFGPCTFPEPDTGVGANKRDVGCPPGESGQHIQVCVDDGASDAWAMETNNCQAVTCGDAAVGTVRESETASCGEGVVGKVLEVCDATGNWVEDTSQCISSCSGSLEDGSPDLTGNAIWPNAPLSTTAYGTCRSGYIGMARRTCGADGQWADLKKGVDYIKMTGCIKTSSLNFPTTGLNLWLDGANTTTLEDTSGNPITGGGTNLGAWRDMSGKQNDFTGRVGNPASAVHTIQTGVTRTVVRFDGDDMLQSSPQADMPTTGTANSELNPSGDFTIFAVTHQFSGAGTWRAIMSSRNIANGQGYVLYAGSDDRYQFWVGTGTPGAMTQVLQSLSATPANVPIETTSYPNNELYLLTARAVDNQLRLYVNDDLVSGIAGVNNGTFTLQSNPSYATRLGAGSNVVAGGNLFMDGDIAELLLYDHAVSTEDRLRIRGYLLSKWGLNIQPNQCPGPAFTNCVLRLKATDIVGDGGGLSQYYFPENGTPVTFWADLSGNGNHFYADPSKPGSHPVFVRDVYTGHPAVRFNGTKQQMLNSLKGAIPAGDDSFTIIVLMQTHLENQDQYIFSQAGNTTVSDEQINVYIRSGIGVGQGTGNPLHTSHSTAHFAANEPLYVAVDIGGTNNEEVHVGDSSVILGTYPSYFMNPTSASISYNMTQFNLSADRMRIGCSFDSTGPSTNPLNCFSGDIFEIFVLSDADEQTKLDSLANAWHEQCTFPGCP